MTRTTLATVCATAVLLLAMAAFAQDGPASAVPQPAPDAAALEPTSTAPVTDQIGLWPLFVQSLDIFTVLLLAGSVTAAWVITLRVMDLRASVVLPESSLKRVDELIRADRIGELRTFVQDDPTMVSAAVRAAIEEADDGPEAMLDAGEMAASAETAQLYRSIDLLNVIGNLGPLVGLAGTVWGMILAFTSLGATAGQAGPEDLSLGISKALFHTLLGLLLAIPCLLSYAVFRQMVDRTATRGLAAASRAVERLAAKRASELGRGPTGAGPQPGPSIPPVGPVA